MQSVQLLNVKLLVHHVNSALDCTSILCHCITNKFQQLVYRRLPSKQRLFVWRQNQTHRVWGFFEGFICFRTAASPSNRCTLTPFSQKLILDVQSADLDALSQYRFVSCRQLNHIRVSRNSWVTKVTRLRFNDRRIEFGSPVGTGDFAFCTEACPTYRSVA